MRKTPELILLILLSLVAPGNAAETLTNADVVQMVAGGLSTELILAKIGLSSPAFVTSVDALVDLKRSGVPDKVLAEMVNAMAGSSKAKSEAAVDSPPSTDRLGADLRERPLQGVRFGGGSANFDVEKIQLLWSPTVKEAMSGSFGRTSTIELANVTRICYFDWSSGKDHGPERPTRSYHPSPFEMRVHHLTGKNKRPAVVVLMLDKEAFDEIRAALFASRPDLHGQCEYSDY